MKLFKENPAQPKSTWWKWNKFVNCKYNVKNPHKKLFRKGNLQNFYLIVSYLSLIIFTNIAKFLEVANFIYKMN